MRQHGPGVFTKGFLWEEDKRCNATVVQQTDMCSFTRTISKFLWHDANLVRHTSSLRNDSDAKCPSQQQERLTLCLKLLHRSVECWLRTSLCQKYLAKTILSKLVNTSLILIFLGILEQRFGEYIKTDF